MTIQRENYVFKMIIIIFQASGKTFHCFCIFEVSRVRKCWKILKILSHIFPPSSKVLTMVDTCSCQLLETRAFMNKGKWCSVWWWCVRTERSNLKRSSTEEMQKSVKTTNSQKFSLFIQFIIICWDFLLIKNTE